MDEQNIQTVPYVVYESMAMRMDLTIKRLIVALIVAIALLFATNVVWLVTDFNYTTDEQVIEAKQDGYGTNLVGGGDINYGADS